MKKIKALIIDDEKLAQENLEQCILTVAEDVNIVASVDSAIKGVTEIKKHKPHLIFLDVEMTGGDGFDLLDAIGKVKPEVIFVTAHAEFAHKAFRYHVSDYLVKPIDLTELEDAINTVRRKVMYLPEPKSGDISEDVIAMMNAKIPLPHHEGVKFIDVKDLVRIEADGSYVTIVSTVMKPQIVSKPLKYYEGLLKGQGFLRIHRSHLVNSSYIAEFLRSEGGIVILKNGETIQVAEKRRDVVLKYLVR